ncbi:MAG: hypothetical protein KBS60_02970 [Phascolarctobacterium sp.]|nr:hypothetical protein [Candidatus Phascolarctobacterium caballi]
MMKKIVSLTIILLTLCTTVFANNVSSDGYWNGIKLCGKVQVVNSFPDIRVKVVNSFPDLKVKIVNHFPDQIGEWQFVDSFPDFKIQFVDSFEDIRIQYVRSFPGVN